MIDGAQHTYEDMTLVRQQEALAQLDEQMWDTMELLAAIQAGRAVLMNVMQRGASE